MGRVGEGWCGGALAGRLSQKEGLVHTHRPRRFPRLCASPGSPGWPSRRTTMMVPGVAAVGTAWVRKRLCYLGQGDPLSVKWLHLHSGISRHRVGFSHESNEAFPLLDGPCHLSWPCYAHDHTVRNCVHSQEPRGVGASHCPRTVREFDSAGPKRSKIPSSPTAMARDASASSCTAVEPPPPPGIEPLALAWGSRALFRSKYCAVPYPVRPVRPV